MTETHTSQPEPPSAALKTAQAPSPSLMQRAWNLAQSVAAFVADGCHTVSGAQYAERLNICQTCDSRQENICLACGCYLPIKAQWRAVGCPLAKWPDLPAGQAG